MNILRSRLEQLFTDRVVATVIVVNTFAFYLDAFPSIHVATGGFLMWVDYGCMLFYISEVLIKVSLAGWKQYWHFGWNKVDFVIVLASVPSLLIPFFDVRAFEFIVFLRLTRLVRLLRILRFVPDGQRIWAGIVRALKASIGVFVALFVLNIILAMGGTILFGGIAPEHFGNPLLSSYSLLKGFTMEGWFEIGEVLADRGGSLPWEVLLRSYFIFTVIVGGILGLSVANAVFVDAMTADNTEPLEKEIALLRAALEKHQAIAASSASKPEDATGIA